VLSQVSQQLVTTTATTTAVISATSNEAHQAQPFKARRKVAHKGLSQGSPPGNICGVGLTHPPIAVHFALFETGPEGPE